MPTALIQQKHPFGSLRTDPHWSVQGLRFYSQFKPAGMLIDETVNKFHGTLVHAPPWVGDALNFDGVNDYVSVPANPRLENFTAFTLGAWVNPQGPPGAGWGRIISKDQGGDSDDYALTYRVNDLTVVCRINTSAGTTTHAGLTEVAANTGWHFFVGTWDGANVRVYLNGVLENTPEANAGNLDDSNLPLGIGGHQASNTRRFNGLVRNAFIYDWALSLGEIQQLYRNPDLPFQQYPAWWGKAPAAGGLSIPIAMHHYKMLRAS